MVNKKLTLLLALLLYGVADAEEQTVLPEVPAQVIVSNRDVNRLVCPGRIQDLIYSQEKGLTGHFSGNSAFLKFMIKEEGTTTTYASVPSEVFVNCDGVIYTLIAKPTNTDSVTIRLSSPQGNRIKANIARFGDMPLEKKALQIIREAYQETYPASYRITSANTPLNLAAGLETTLTQAVDVDGVGLRLKKYSARATGTNEIRLEEKTFLTSQVSDSILAVAVEDHSLLPGNTTRVFVVEKKEKGQ
jgi:conjugal transfer pilus assembly protein TraK